MPRGRTPERTEMPVAGKWGPYQSRLDRATDGRYDSPTLGMAAPGLVISQGPIGASVSLCAGLSQPAIPDGSLRGRTRIDQKHGRRIASDWRKS